ncbi:hypothetical protein C8T65DRAFT_711462 [Cerioporus squamosus]|nr:hypothetical protein C8T65DRAFT_711462 [Cerioporus squamosus]
MGHHARLAMIPLVCDLVGARQVAGLGPFDHTYMLCSCCTRSQHDIEDFRPAPPRDLQAHLAAATAWRDAQSTQARENLFKYNDASGLNSTKPPPRPAPKVMDQALDALLHGSDSALKSFGKPALYHLCLDRNLQRAGTIRMLMRHLKIWPRTLQSDYISQDAEPQATEAVAAQELPLKKTKIVGSGASTLERVKSPEGLVRKGLEVLRQMCRDRALPTEGQRKDLAETRQAAMQRTQATLATSSCPEDSRLTLMIGPVRTVFQVLPPTAALGAQTLAEYVRDQTHMEVPSWVNPAPRAFGTSEHGKLSADQWRTVALSNLPAVGILGYLESDKPSLARADELLQKYLAGVKELYKGAKIIPNHHIALHLTMFIALFGPVHSWRAFAFERLNFLLQTLNVNGNFGELEMTFMMQMSRMANLRPILRTDTVKNAMPTFVAAYNRLSQEDRRGMRLDETMRGASDNAIEVVDRKKGILLDDNVYRALRDRIRLEGTVYKGDGSGQDSSRRDSRDPPSLCRSRAQGDSNVIFCYPAFEGKGAGRIEQIFIHKRRNGWEVAEEIYLVMRRLTSLNDKDRSLDPYQSFPIGGALYYDEYNKTLLVVRPSDLVCHFAKTSMRGVVFAKEVTAAAKHEVSARHNDT